MNKFTVGRTTIGHESPCFVIAEMSCNHLGDYQRAEAIVRAAASAGADAVKLQTFKPDSLTLKSDREEFVIRSDNQWNGLRLYDLYKEVHTPWEWHEPLKNMVEEQGMVFLSSVFDEEAVDFLESLGVLLYKIASFELTHLPLIRHVAEKGKPIIASTGMATLSDIDRAVRLMRECGNDQIALLRCISSYPACPEETNIRTIPHIGETFRVIPGFSDHTLGHSTALTAVAVGARIIEKHFTLCRGDGGPDSFFSMEPDEFKTMVDSIRTAESALGKPVYGPSEGEKPNLAFRRSIYVVRDMKAGDLFEKDAIRVIRPGHGLAPRHYEHVLGRRARRDISIGEPLSWAMID